MKKVIKSIFVLMAVLAVSFIPQFNTLAEDAEPILYTIRDQKPEKLVMKHQGDKIVCIDGLYYLLCPHKTVTDADGEEYYYAEIPDVYCKAKEESMTTIEGQTDASALNIKDYITDDGKTYEVKRIGKMAFAWSAARVCTIPDTVETIGFGAFYYCTGLNELILPENLKTIDDNAFRGCQGLSSITIPKNVTRIEWGTFSYCKNLLNIYLLADEVLISNEFKYTNPLCRMYFENFCQDCPFKLTIHATCKIQGVRGKVYQVYDSNIDMTHNYDESKTVVINCTTTKVCTACNETHTIIDESKCKDDNNDARCDTCKRVLYGAQILNNTVWWKFDEATGELHIDGSGAASVNGKYPWESLIAEEKIKNITFGEQITAIGDNAFAGIKLDSLTIPRTIKTIGKHSFEKATLGSITLEDGIELIDEYAFCEINKEQALENLTIPGTIKTIGKHSFEKAMLGSITLEDGIELIDEYAFCEINNKQTIESLTVPGSIKTIGNYAFYYVYIKNLTLEEGIEYIDSHAFACNSKVTKLILPDSLIKVSLSGFDSTLNLKYLYFNTNTQFGSNIFTYYTFEEIHVPYDFDFSLTEEGKKWNKVGLPNDISKYKFLDKHNCCDDSNCPLGLNNSVVEHKMVSNGNEKHICTICDKEFDHTFDADRTCSECGFTQYEYEVIEGTKTVKITGIKRGFADYSEDLVIPETINVDGENYTVTEIGKSAFENDDSLTGNLKLPDSLTTIGQEAFSGCGFTGNLTIPNSVTTIGEFAFSECSFTGNVTIPDSVTTIENNAISNCIYIDNISVPCSIDTVFFNGVNKEQVTYRKHEFIDQGNGKHKCSSCGKLVNHDFTKQDVTKATLSLDGKIVTKCEDCGVVDSTTTIYCPKTFTLSASSYTYDGKAKKPTVTVKDGNGNTIADTNYTVSYTDSNGLAVTAPTKIGTYMVKVVFDGNYEGTQDISYTIKVQPVTNITVSATSFAYTGSALKPTVTVKASDGTTITSSNYTVALLDSAGKTVSSTTAVGSYKLKVTLKGNYSGTKTFTYKINPSKVAIGATAIQTNGIKVSWTKNTSCSGYQILKSVDGGAFNVCKTITGNATTSFIDTSANVNGKKYQYKIRGFKEVGGVKYYSADSSVKTDYFFTKPALTVTPTATSFKLSWTKNAKATGYYVYRSTDGTNYKPIKTITSNATISYTDTATKTNGSKYYYKLVAFKTVGNVKYTSTASVVTKYYVARPTISSLTNTATGKLTAKWGKNSKANGYVIQYSKTNDFKSNKSYTITSGSTVTKTFTGLTKGSKYYVRIRAYKTVGGVKYYSAWSASKYITITK